ncbi:MAG: hypothetical protein JRN24_01110 [Nitrososphaerota archaeon]|nr:hypothetical protein [Nitrososphaerota archaeon]
MTDWVGAAEVALSAFFVVLAVVLLVRYRQASEGVTESSELNRDLWGALEGRLKKQDERIVDIMARLEVVQVRVAAERVLATPQIQPLTQQVTSQNVTPSQPQIQPHAELKSALEPRVPIPVGELDVTEKTALKFLEGGAKPTPEITERLGRSREHTARLMKSLYDRGLVERDESGKPFVYKLAEAGKKYLV